ncbi:MAG: DNA alkylation repair protein [Myxococcota bacterium]
MNATRLTTALKSLGNATIAAHSQRFFKTGPGEYGEGDVFIGVRMPALRKLSKKHRSMARSEVKKLLRSPIHEVRMCALLILVEQFKRSNEDVQDEIYALYLANTKFVNGWDLVDCSAHLIVGPCLFDRSRAPLTALARSDSLWERRIAIIATLHFIRVRQFDDTLTLAKILLKDPEDLIHKAVGWMLREVGKRDPQVEIDFLEDHYKQMPRTMLRYAIEKFPEDLRQDFLKRRI